MEKTISKAYKRYDITFSGTLEDVGGFWYNICDFIHKNRSALYKKSRYRLRSTPTIVDEDFAQGRISIIAKAEDDFRQRLIEFLYIEQKNENIADYSVVGYSAASELACNW